MASSPNIAKGEGLIRSNDLLEHLINDVYKTFELLDPDKESQFFRRILIRSIFNCIEATIEIIKRDVLSDIRLNEKDVTLSKRHQKILYGRITREDGTIEQVNVPLEENLKGVFKIAQKVWNLEKTALDCSSEEYKYFLSAKEARNKLTHPKTFYDIQITENDIIRAAKAFEWFRTGFISLFEAHMNNIIKELPEDLQERLRMQLRK